MADKYIIIPEYKPLYAMRYCFGPTHGPLEKPCPTPIDVIGKLLLQTGNEKLSIYEVKVDPKTHKTVGEPVQLTLTNYKRPYDDIVSGDNKVVPGTSIGEMKEPDPVVFKPVKEEPKEDSAIVTPVKEESLVETKTLEEKVVEIPEEEPDEIDEAMIQEAEKDNDSETVPLEEVKNSFNKTVVVTTAASADGTVATNSNTFVAPETPVDAPFVTGTVVGNVEEPSEFVTISSTDNYMVPVTTAEGTKMIDTGMTEAEYKALSKSERRRLRKSLVGEDTNED